MKLYISGPMTGIKDFNYPLFQQVTADLRAKGHEVVTPTELATIEDSAQENGWKICMKKCIIGLLDCDSIICLPDWYKSRGAVVELIIAKALGMKQFELRHAGEDVYVETTRWPTKQLLAAILEKHF